MTSKDCAKGIDSAISKIVQKIDRATRKSLDVKIA
jgi:hypothetical protein